MGKMTTNWRHNEPLIHSHVTDVLEDGHPLAYKSVACKKCGVPLHAGNNECMQTWIEWGPHCFCTKCAPLRDVLEPADFENEPL